MKKKLTLVLGLLFVFSAIAAQKKSKTFSIDQNAKKYIVKNHSASKFAVYANLLDPLIHKYAHVGVNYAFYKRFFAEVGFGIPTGTKKNSELDQLFLGSSSHLQKMSNGFRSSGDSRFIDGKTNLLIHTGIYKSYFSRTLASTIYGGIGLDYETFKFNYENRNVPSLVPLTNSLRRFGGSFITGSRSKLFGISRLQIDVNIGIGVGQGTTKATAITDDDFNGGSSISYGGVGNIRLIGLIF